MFRELDIEALDSSTLWDLELVDVEYLTDKDITTWT